MRSCLRFAHLLPVAMAFGVLGHVLPARAADDYPLGPDSKVQDGVPKGEIIQDTFDQSRIFPGTWREYWVYVPRQLDRAKAAPVMVFQDGIQYHAPTVFDNLIQRKEIPALVGIFVSPGRVKPLNGTNALDRFNRSYEYDGLGDTYARFLLDELLPHIARKHDLSLSASANDRAIAGASSGGICAFTAAWERPDAFRRVFSSIGTFVGLRGGNHYPTIIRKVEPKPIRVYLQDGSSDQNIYGGDWWMANQEMERSLVFAGYDVNHAWGDGGHSGTHANAIFPEVLRWLWRDYPAPITANPERKSKQPVAGLLLPEEGWQVVSSGHGFTEGPAANARGEVFFTDIPARRIHKIGLDGAVTIFAEDTGNANGMMFGPDGRLYVCATARKQIVAYDEAGRTAVVAGDIAGNDLCLNQRGDLYVTDPDSKTVWLVGRSGEKRVVDKGIEFPNGVVLSPDQSLLYVSDTRGQFVYSFSVTADGALTNKQRYFHLHLPDGSTGSGADGMTVDTNGTLYVATSLGIQFCDQVGRVNGILLKPQENWLSNVVFGGAGFGELFVTCGDKVYRRKTTGRGVYGFEPLFKPRTPRL